MIIRKPANIYRLAAAMILLFAFVWSSVVFAQEREVQSAPSVICPNHSSVETESDLFVFSEAANCNPQFESSLTLDTALNYDVLTEPTALSLISISADSTDLVSSLALPLIFICFVALTIMWVVLIHRMNGSSNNGNRT